MITFETSAVELASAALGHFFFGLMKADAGLSSSEKDKVLILIYKFANIGLPGEYGKIADHIDSMENDEDYTSWSPEDHLQEGFRLYDAFRDTGEATAKHSEILLEALEIVMEVGTISPGEEAYLSAMQAGFANR
jgi:hypothetical protein